MISQGTWNKKTHQIYNTDTKGTHKFKMVNTPLTQKEKLLNPQQNEVCSLGEVGNASTLAWLYDIKRRGKFPERCKAWFQKMNPLEFKLRHPRWKASQLWFQGAAREKEQGLWQDNRSGLIPYASSLREMDGYGLGEETKERVGGKQTVTCLWCSIFPHHSLAYQTGLEDWRSRKGSTLGRRGM